MAATARYEVLQVESIPRRSGLSQAEFVAKYLKPLKPVVITDAITAWRALKEWTPEFFEDRYGSRQVSIDNQLYKLAHLMDSLANSNEHRPAPYLRNEVIERFAPELEEHISPRLGYALPNWLDGPLSWKLHGRFDRGLPQLYIGGKGAAFPFMHYDVGHTHAFLSQIYGHKAFVLYAPDQTEFLYPTANFRNISSIDDLDHPNLDQYPLFPRALRHDLILDPGETIFIPGGWWHTAKILDLSITVSVNIANFSNWSQFSRDYSEGASKLGKLKLRTYLAGVRLARSLIQS